MSEVSNPAEPPEPEHLTGDRLDSWKEIAAFLQRDVRTVQRWEKYAGLPVHRHSETRLRTAYAYRSELDAWWRAQRAAIEPSGSSDAQLATDASAERADLRGVTAGRPRRLRFVAMAIGLSTVVGVGSAVWVRQSGAPSATTLIRPRVPVLVATFEHQAEDAALATAVEQAVARQLPSQHGLEPIAPAQAARILRLMRRDPGAPVSEMLGRELAVREGRIKYVVAGRVHTWQAKYFAEIRAVDPDGRTHAHLEWQAATTDELISRSQVVVPEFAQRLIDVVAPERAPAESLELVTSPSTAAVRLYTAALQAGLRGQWGASELLARRAIALDADFASAHAWVGWTMRRQGRRARECLPFLERAQALAHDATDRETYLISAMLHSVSGELRPAASALEALLRLDASDRQALDILIEVSWRMGRVRRAVDLSIVRAETYPDDFYANVRAAQALAAVKGDTDRAAAFADRARQLAAADTVGDRPSWHAWLNVLPVFQRWVAGDTRGALDVLDVLDRSLSGRLGRERDAFAAAVGFAHLAFGRAEQAEHAFRYGSAPDRQMNLAVLALTKGDEDGARRWLGQVREHAALRPALFARAGYDREAERGLDALLPSDHAEGIAAVTRGLLALRLRQMEPAAAALREGLDLLRSSGEASYFLASEALAGIADARGDVNRSIRLLTDAAAERANTYGLSQWTAAYWIRSNNDLIQLCQRTGRHEEAERISAGLRQILDAEYADRIPGGTAPAVVR